jgi:hypothetical protein
MIVAVFAFRYFVWVNLFELYSPAGLCAAAPVAVALYRQTICLMF